MLIEFRPLLKEIKPARAHQRVFSEHLLNETSRWIMRLGDMNGDEKSVEWQLSLWIAFLLHNIAAVLLFGSLVDSHTFLFNPHWVPGRMILAHL